MSDHPYLEFTPHHSAVTEREVAHWVDLHVRQGLAVSLIARRAGRGEETVRRAMKAQGVYRPAPGGRTVPPNSPPRGLVLNPSRAAGHRRHGGL